ncbi:MAG TPA: hypothetical protein P5121_33425 [Caldilineaceae bacterium]|nr:hypothetical protein [Caldilineaceae bacterium]HRW10068.1 hypothetical protein [Caldilineaceae bacterium]
MSDKPRPGKDKDLRFIKSAIEDADEVYRLFASELINEQSPGVIELISEGMLLIIEQYDELNQMLDDVALTPTRVLDHNRCLRDLLKLMIKERLSPLGRVAAASIIQVLGNQLRSLMVTKEIRGTEELCVT